MKDIKHIIKHLSSDPPAQWIIKRSLHQQLWPWCISHGAYSLCLQCWRKKISFCWKIYATIFCKQYQAFLQTKLWSPGFYSGFIVAACMNFAYLTWSVTLWFHASDSLCVCVTCLQRAVNCSENRILSSSVHRSDTHKHTQEQNLCFLALYFDSIIFYYLIYFMLK